MIKVLFVCLGNICRSPMAEAVFQQMVNAAGLGNQITVDSAGTSNWHEGERAHGGTLKVLSQNGIEYQGRSRPLVLNDLTQFDYVVTMDRSNLSNVQRLMSDGTTAEIVMFLSYANRDDLTDVEEVPDPYYTGGFDEVYELVRKGSQALLDHIRSEHNL